MRYLWLLLLIGCGSVPVEVKHFPITPDYCAEVSLTVQDYYRCIMAMDSMIKYENGPNKDMPWLWI